MIDQIYDDRVAPKYLVSLFFLRTYPFALEDARKIEGFWKLLGIPKSGPGYEKAQSRLQIEVERGDATSVEEVLRRWRVSYGLPRGLQPEHAEEEDPQALREEALRDRFSSDEATRAHRVPFLL